MHHLILPARKHAEPKPFDRDSQHGGGALGKPAHRLQPAGGQIDWGLDPLRHRAEPQKSLGDVLDIGEVAALRARRQGKLGPGGGGLEQ